MGREWYFNWGSKSSKKDNNAKGGRGGRGGGDRKSGLPKVATAAAAVAASGGCMNTVLHMFDFNHLNLCLHPNNNNNNNNGSYPQDDTIVPLKGVEAPRNSLESVKDEDDTISVDVRIKTNRRDTGLKLVQAPRPKVEDTMSQSSCSPSSTSARTPTLVARLMGLDILPESTSTTPRSSSSYTRVATSSSTPPSTIRTPKSRTKDGGHSRPRTPNSSSMSSQRSKSTDTVDSHRLSLQISNKESSIVKEMESSRPSCSAINTKRRDGRKYVCEEGNKSPGYYARQIMKQVKETVSRRAFGADITNTGMGSCSSEEVRRDEHLLSTTKQQQQQQPKKSRKEQSTASPKMVKSLETGKKCSERVSDLQQSVEKAQLKTVVMRESEKKTVDLMKKLDGTKQSSKIISIKNKKDEQFVRASTRSIVSSTVDKKCRKTPLSNIEQFVRPSTNKLPEIQDDLIVQEGSLKASQVPKLVNTTSTRLSHGPAQRTHEKPQEKAGNYPAFHEKKEGISTSSIVECQYISRILKCTGIDRDTPISFTRWFSTSHPLNPTIFHTLEATHYPPTMNNNPNNSIDRRLIDRKLIFHLVDEILAEILNPYIKIKPISRHHNNPKQIIQINGFQLVKTLSTKIRSFPRANCKTLQDIDALVEKDLPKLGVVSDNLIAIDEEFEDIVSEIEAHIVDSLVQEIITMFCFDNGHMNRKRCTLYNGLIR